MVGPHYGPLLPPCAFPSGCVHGTPSLSVSQHRRPSRLLANWLFVEEPLTSRTHHSGYRPLSIFRLAIVVPEHKLVYISPVAPRTQSFRILRVTSWIKSPL